MWPSLLEVLVDPIDKGPLHVADTHAGPGESIDRGTLVGNGRRYEIRAGIPRFVRDVTTDQEQTAASFGYKWGRRSSYESPAMYRQAQQWLVARYGFSDLDAMTDRFARANRVLDAGCGSGFSSALWMTHAWRSTGTARWYGLDISSAIDVAQDRLGCDERLHYVQADVTTPPFAPGTFDLIISEGVLHHTPSTENAFRALVPLLCSGGELMFYVYRRKAPIREFADDHIRAAIASMPPDAAWEALKPLTSLGQALAEVRATVTLPDDIPFLGIRAGAHDVQRLMYWHFAKMFWNPDLSFDENHHVNFDWYHPRYAHRHTEADVRQWCDDAGLTIVHFDDTNESGFTVRAIRS